MKTVTTLLIGALLMMMSTPVWAQKPVVGISAIEVAAQNISCKDWKSYRGTDCNQYLTKGFRAMLETAIVKSNKMEVMERNQLTGILGEQLLGQKGITTSGGRIGGLTGVDYLIYGSITKFGKKESGFGISGLGGLIGGKAGLVASKGLSTAEVTTEMAVDLKVTDVATGRIILADTVEGRAKTGEAFSVAGISSSETGADPFSDVQRIVAAKISEAVVTTRIPFKVIKVQRDGTLIINYGNGFLKEGDVLALFDVGEQFVDPDTGEVLGSEEIEIGAVQIVSAQPRFSKARVIGEGTPISVGNVLKRSKVAVGQKTSSDRKRSGTQFFAD